MDNHEERDKTNAHLRQKGICGVDAQGLSGDPNRSGKVILHGRNGKMAAGTYSDINEAIAKSDDYDSLWANLSKAGLERLERPTKDEPQRGT